MGLYLKVKIFLKTPGQYFRYKSKYLRAFYSIFSKIFHIKLVTLRNRSGGDYISMLSVGFVLTLPNTVWYHPVGFIKLFLAITICYFVLKYVLPKKMLPKID